MNIKIEIDFTIEKGRSNWIEGAWSCNLAEYRDLTQSAIERELESALSLHGALRVRLYTSRGLEPGDGTREGLFVAFATKGTFRITPSLIS